MDGEISTDEVARSIESDDPPLIVDIRPPEAFARGHIPGSENVPFPRLADRIEDIAAADPDHVVTVCPKGQSSVQAARLIASYEGTGDARVESMAGGLDEWSGDLVTDGVTGTDGDGTDGTSESGAADAPF